MSGEGKGSLKALVSAAGAGSLFLLLWLAIGLPLPYSAAAGGAGYLALWLLIGGASPRGAGEGRIGDFVDKELAKRTTAQAFAFAKALEESCAGFDAKDPLLPKFRKLAGLLRAIGEDVESDPKDAQAASLFIGLQGETGKRLAGLLIGLESRGASREQVAAARERVETALGRLILAYERHLARLQEDNLDELQAELDLLEQSLGLEE
jgi:hypothetical protein